MPSAQCPEEQREEATGIKITCFRLFYAAETTQVQREREMRHAVAPAENVENHSFAVTGLFKICTHCERLGKKVRERREGGRNRKKKRKGSERQLSVSLLR